MTGAIMTTADEAMAAIVNRHLEMKRTITADDTLADWASSARRI
jgi:acyl-coenzyme A thioesterase PaaI-like protein